MPSKTGLTSASLFMIDAHYPIISSSFACTSDRNLTPPNCEERYEDDERKKERNTLQEGM